MNKIIRQVTLFASAAVIALTVSQPASAQQNVDNRAVLSLGGALSAAQFDFRSMSGGGFSTGLFTGADVTGGGFGTGSDGGYVAWTAGRYRLDAVLRPFADGGVAADFGAWAGAGPGELGTSYGLHMGTAWVGDRFSVNPSSRFGLAEVPNQAGDVNLTFTVNHALTPDLSVVGAAEARRTMGAQPDATVNQSEVVVGAGLGLRF